MAVKSTTTVFGYKWTGGKGDGHDWRSSQWGAERDREKRHLEGSQVSEIFEIEVDRDVAVHTISEQVDEFFGAKS